MARNRSERMPQPPEGWGDACVRVAHLIAEDLANVYEREYASHIVDKGWPRLICTPGTKAHRELSSHDLVCWFLNIPAMRAYVAAAFLEAHAKKQK